ncbi:DUF3078 domain-containing protein [Rapidithrix thailandica]|uniref:DUF3078 domain-containing protein n=1 Tax=Rapidithrix thailandica TaxID=413964 RepID=A0AAW9SC90_9BACT
MKVKLLVVLMAFLPLISVAQEQEEETKNWKTIHKFTFDLTQAAFSDNWKGGGVSNVALASRYNLKAGYKEGNFSWDNEVDLRYGLIKNKGEDMRKSEDLIFIDSKVGHKLSKAWSLFVGLNFQTQFAKGYKFEEVNGEEVKNQVSEFLAPGFLTTSIGFEYKPVDYFFVRLSPFAPRTTFVLDTTLYKNGVPKNYGVPIGDKVELEWLALNIVADFDKEIAKNLNLKWKYQLFSEYENFDFETVDHRLDLTLSAQVNKFIRTSISGIVLYDNDQDSGVQFGQSLALGLIFTNEKKKE